MSLDSCLFFISACLIMNPIPLLPNTKLTLCHMEVSFALSFPLFYVLVILYLLQVINAHILREKRDYISRIQHNT